jgi:hypothetical protein
MKWKSAQEGDRKEKDIGYMWQKKENCKVVKKHTSAQGLDAGLAFVTLGIRIAT